MKRMALGGGGRFAALKAKLSRRKGVYNPAGLAAYIGRRKYGRKRFAELSAAGRRRRARERLVRALTGS